MRLSRAARYTFGPASPDLFRRWERLQSTSWILLAFPLPAPKDIRMTLAGLSAFRSELHACFTRRANALFELAEAVLCADGPVRTLVGLSLAPEHRRGHGALYDAVNHGRINVGRLRNALARLPLPQAADGRIVLAVDVSPWLRPDADTSEGRSFCHTFGRGEGKHQTVPGWPYSIVAAGGHPAVDAAAEVFAALAARHAREGAETTAVELARLDEALRLLAAQYAAAVLVAVAAVVSGADSRCRTPHDLRTSTPARPPCTGTASPPHRRRCPAPGPADVPDTPRRRFPRSRPGAAARLQLGTYTDVSHLVIGA
ncbi:transposase [Streptodolium elevatio]|uniref:transposase n=1 Tax=Streptodolium elevatio TaxID=3157996 RepID=UPI003F4CCFA1